jgi:cytochrome c
MDIRTSYAIWCGGSIASYTFAMRRTLYAAAMLIWCSWAGAQPPEPEARQAGLTLWVYELQSDLSKIVRLVPGQTPNVSKYVAQADLKDADFEVKDQFLAELHGFLQIDVAGEYEFELRSDDGSELLLNNQQLINHDGLHGMNVLKTSKITLQPGAVPVSIRMIENYGDAGVRLSWKPPGATAWEVVPLKNLFTQANVVHVTSPGKKNFIQPLPNTRPGDGEPLVGVHPSFTLESLHNESFQPRVGGIDFLPDGKMVVCRWEPDGGVDIVDLSTRPVTVKRFAQGLQEPLGIKVVDGQIYVLEKQQLTLLVDLNNDGFADEYRNVCGGWNVTDNFHEFAFGLVYVDGFFYANLAVAINPGGRTTVPQVSGRGQVIKIDPITGTFETVAMGIRTPNGIGLGPDQSIWITDNQGDWLPSSKLIKLVPGAFYGSHLEPNHAWSDRVVTPPVAWLPQGEIGNSPSQPGVMQVGPWKGQIIHGDVTHGGLKRTFLDELGGAVPNGCVFRFTQGLAAGVNRIAWGPDGSLYVGGIGSTGNWGQADKKWAALEKLTFNSKVAFEPLAVRLFSNGIEIEFTEPVDADTAGEATWYNVRQFRYEPTPGYGGPKLDDEALKVKSATRSTDGLRVFLELDGVKPNHVLYLRLADVIRSASGESLWTTEAWYTINTLATDRAATVATQAVKHNVLSDSEVAAGWKLLFDGQTTTGWRGFKRDAMPDGWQVMDGELVRTAGGGDIITSQEFGDFELTLEWNIAQGGNSGIFSRATELADAPWMSAAEMQVLDNRTHSDGRTAITSAGACYGLIEPVRDASLGADRWNRVRILAIGPKFEYWLNNHKVVEFDTSSDAFKQLVANSKFKDFPQFTKSLRGGISLQDHGDRVRFRNIKIREMK